ncbi:hypothetical protein PROPHIGD17-1_30 [Mycobacterium phage prophiGD17-1]|nr:hypothetical protein PHIGD17-1_69 [Mycobacterium phage phiGD17-1]QSM02678.1 hypothetical protein PROPHIGD17-1_30 [Mycobacterium phage prophiGD17-1]QSM39502.1 hypothetical protein IMZ79_05680 [Mycobacteroides abscessus subsp. abscessus]
MTMAQHEMRDPSENRCVARKIDGAFYRVSWNGSPGGDVILPEGALGVVRSPVSHHNDRVATIDRPVVRVTPLGRTWRIGYNIDGQFRVEAIA